ncbi:hypothetical protein MCOR27_008466 [Pyricularia oryzae]|uniref:DNA polymerase eta n=1 Tax=Pyricularia grisea TaxID=148305 RepID=A0ABQ8NKW9_PYRGI|nr:hypothetical protein MCOR01_009916 [Pyricularia oryzae]KAI6297775.1 hypothetical protein MCOR33_005946 [Pyricularia grisea]KAH9436780.1 hypothetical protein MCOR02_000445 [Pyricularia oryzae]KAI6263201.1 hypothetical protein MCOR19_000528 [Pyricularia oryzae]KAI6272199.1 hypothetical protein MCOR27_008466 [Pyricularia oryzae]
MSSSSPLLEPKRFFRDTSPVDAAERTQSQFTYRQLSQLAAYSTSCPLRVISHIDLDAFYAQCEMVRLGVDEDRPLAVQQWQGLIAVNYPARKFGISRHCTIDDALKLCPELQVQHVATWREGDDTWAYRGDAAANIATDKVSLDPYRLQSRTILALIKECLPPHQCKVEKASIDEVFIDLSANVHSKLIERFPELASPPPGADAQARLPLPPVSALDWQADALIELDETETETDDPDWDDIALLIASEITRDIRQTIFTRLKYTCSAGVAGNKLLSKLGSAHKKPNQQTVIRGRAVRKFLSDFKFTKIRNLGGKLGDQVVAAFGTESVSDLLEVPLDQLKLRLGEESTALWVYNTIRGIDNSEVNSRTQIKSMLSAKSFRPSIHSVDQANKWLRIFSADIFSRLVEEGVLENKRRPKTMNLHHRHNGQSKARSCPIPQGVRVLDDSVLYELAQNLLRQIVMEGKVWPCDNLSLNVSGFEDGITGNMGIGGFLVKGEEAQGLRSVSNRDNPAGHQETQQQQHHDSKRRKINGGGLHRFFGKATQQRESSSGPGEDDEYTAKAEGSKRRSQDELHPTDAQAEESMQEAIGSSCPRCKDVFFNTPEELQDHLDWHLAKDLQDEEERGASAFATRRQPTSAAPPAKPRGRGRPPKGAAKPKTDPGQRRLRFD